MNYYNEIDPQAAQWLRNLISAGLIPPGDVDERSIEDVVPNELRGYVQCHFFCGIAGWPLALDLAGWDRNRPAWTGSAPCQPFSSAGKGAGFADERHLWPAFQHLIAQCKPPVVFGEQVASKATGAWIDLVHADLENMGYAFGCVPFSAASIGAPHIRDRNYWVADAYDKGPQGRVGSRNGAGQRSVVAGGVASRMADADSAGSFARSRGTEAARHRNSPIADGKFNGMADASGQRRQQDARSASGDEEAHGRAGRHRRQSDGDHVATGLGEVPGARSTGPVNGHWRDADWLLCRDGKWRPVEPGTFPLAHGIPARVVRLRAYGNSIVPQAAAAFISAYMSAEQQMVMAA